MVDNALAADIFWRCMRECMLVIFINAVVDAGTEHKSIERTEGDVELDDHVKETGQVTVE
jgi:hypothetical protein